MKQQKKTSPPPHRSEREHVLWLLDFLRRDIANLRSGELLDLRDDVLRFRVEASAADVDDIVVVIDNDDAAPPNLGL